MLKLGGGGRGKYTQVRQMDLGEENVLLFDDELGSHDELGLELEMAKFQIGDEEDD